MPEAHDIPVVLVGGAVVSIYSQGAYRSGDLDLVAEDLFGKDVNACMQAIGFHLKGRHFEHPQCRHLFVEFVRGPLGIGEDLDIIPRREQVGDQVLKILSPTDCVRDRLASFIHFQARDCLDQAILVAKAQTIEWPVVAAWCTREGPKGIAAFNDLKARIEG